MQNDYIKHTIIKSKMLNITVIIAITVVLVSKLFPVLHDCFQKVCMEKLFEIQCSSLQLT